LGDRYTDVPAQHRRVLRAAFREFGGWEVGAKGDASFVAFAVAAARAMSELIAETLMVGPTGSEDPAVSRRPALPALPYRTTSCGPIDGTEEGIA
jgi:hypothetical protein